MGEAKRRGSYSDRVRQANEHEVPFKPDRLMCKECGSETSEVVILEAQHVSAAGPMYSGNCPQCGNTTVAVEAPQNPDDLFKLVDQAVERWSDIVVPIFVESKKSRQAVNGLGTAYLCAEGDRTFMVTALHVVHDANRSEFQLANICGKAVDLGGLKVTTLKEYDIAVAHLSDEWIESQGLKKVKSAPLKRDLAGWHRTGVFVAMGYPGTKNKLDTRYNKVDRNCLSLTLSAAPDCDIKTDVKDAIVLSYDHKSVVNSQMEKLGPQPDLYGMSGGPCLELLIKGGENPVVTFEPIGILAEWHKNQRAIVAAPISALLSRLP